MRAVPPPYTRGGTPRTRVAFNDIMKNELSVDSVDSPLSEEVLFVCLSEQEKNQWYVTLF
jgi:hypothetical protein